MIEPTGDPVDLGVLAAVVRRQGADLSVYADFLVQTLAGALPTDQIIIHRKKGLFGRSRPDTPVTSVAVTLGENTFRLHQVPAQGPPRATISHQVGGIVLSDRSVDLGEWSDRLAHGLVELARSNDAAAAALARLTRFIV